MSFLTFDVNDFIGTLYNLFCLCTICIMFGLALNVEHYQEKARELKKLIRLNKALKGLRDIEQ